MRLLLDNVFDSYSSLTATNEVASLPIANVAKEGKTTILRTSTTSTTITVTWAADQTISMVAIPWANFSSSATVRVRYRNSADTVTYDSTALGAGSVFPAPKVRGVEAGVNSFPYGGAGSAVLWLTQRSDVRSMLIDISDTGVTAIEVARIVCGKYIEPTVSPDVGAVVQWEDSSAHERAESGDLRTARHPRQRKMRLDMQMMKATDRATLWDLVRSSGYAAPFFVSMLPTSSNNDERAMHSMWSRLVTTAQFAYQFVDSYATTLEMEEL